MAVFGMPGARTDMSRRPEAKLEAEVLPALFGIDGVSVFKNEVGQGFYGAALPLLERLAERGPGAFYAGWRSILYRNRLTFGLGEGSPDLVGHKLGGFFGIELKSERGRMRPAQIKWHLIERAKGVPLITARTVGDCVDFVKGLKT